MINKVLLIQIWSNHIICTVSLPSSVSQIVLLCLQATFIFSLVKYTPLKFNNTTPYPWWGYALGWWFTLSSTLLVPIFMIYNLSVTPGTLRQVRACVFRASLLQVRLHVHVTTTPPPLSLLCLPEVLHAVHSGWRVVFERTGEESPGTVRFDHVSRRHGVLSGNQALLHTSSTTEKSQQQKIMLILGNDRVPNFFCDGPAVATRV